MRETETWSWMFGGPLRELPPALAWAALGALLLAGSAAVIVSYRRPSRELSAWRRALLAGLRGALLLGLVFCLADPVRVRRELLDSAPSRPLAVLIDRSDSMTMPDNRGHGRLDGALRAWRGMRSTADERFGRVDYAAFGRERAEASGLDDALERNVATDQTLFFDSLGAALAAAPPGGYGGIVTLTDALDTSASAEEGEARLAQAAMEQQTPLFFLPGKNRLRPGSGLLVRETRVPSEVLRRSELAYEAVIEGSLPEAGPVQVTLREGERVIASEQIDFAEGYNLRSWKHKLTSGEPGPMLLELQVGEGGDARLARNAVSVVAKQKVSVLYYQGALDWGYRFLASALARDPSFQMTAVFNPAAGVRIRTSTGAPADLPATPGALEPYRVVVLASVFAPQLSAAQQKALADYARAGGGVLFICPDGEAAREFAGTALEEMLPVVFQRAKPQDARGEAERRFQDLMSRNRFSNAEMESRFAGEAEGRTDSAPLTPFAIPKDSPLSSLLTMRGKDGKARPIVPAFTEYAAVERAKPAAEVLAWTPPGLVPEGPRILLASQPFGRGRVMALTTDSLWRWKLSLPSASREAEIFWQQLLLWLAQNGGDGLRFVEPPTQVPLGAATTFAVSGAAGAVKVTATAPDGKARALTSRRGKAKGQWEADWKPEAEGFWKISAATEDGKIASAHVNVREDSTPPELMKTPPDLARMQRLAETTGGAILRDEPPAAWRQTPEKSAQVLSEQRELLWNRWAILLACGGVFSAELLLRRKWRLL